MKNTTVNILGKGNVGSSLLKGLEKAGYTSTAVGNDKDAVRKATSTADIVIIAVPYLAIDSLIEKAGDLFEGKTVIDATNALDQNMGLALGYSTSAAEELQKKLPGAKVVKAFNTVFAPYMSEGHLKDSQLTTFVASDYEDAKATVSSIAEDLGFDVVNAGPLNSSRSLEPMGLLQIQLGFVHGMGLNIGFKLIHE